MATKQDLNKQIQQEINKLSGDTQKYWQGIADKLTAAGAKGKELEQILVAIREVSYQWEESLTSLQNKWDRLTKKFQEAGSELDQAMRAQRGLNSLAKQIIDHKSGEEKLSAKNLESIKKEFTAKTQMLITLKQLTEEQQKEAKEYLEYLTEEIKKRKEIEKKLGFAKTVLDGIAKIPILGELIGAEDVLEQMSEAAEDGASFLETMSVGAKALGKNLMASLKDPFTLIMAIGKEIFAVLSGADKATGELAKKFNITYDEAARTREQLTQIANLSMDSAVNTRGLQESLIAVGQSLGSNAALNEKDLITFTKLREQAGFANEELAEMQKYTLATGGNLEDNVANLMLGAKTTAYANGVALNEKDIMRDIAKTGNAVKLSIVGGATALGKAAAEAKSFGMNLDQVDKIAGSLMDFESSINAELEAQLVTGKNINLEQARLYALNNNYEGLSREIAKNIGSAADFNKMNRIQQEAVAKAVGMTREELATTLTDQEALKGLSGEQAEKGREALAAARAKGMTDKEIAKAGINDLMKQQDVQERFNQSVEKVKEVFISIAEPILRIVSPLTDLVTHILPLINVILTPALTTFQYIADSIAGWLTLFDGGLSKLTTMQQIVGFIGTAIIGWKVATMAYTAYQTFAAAVTAMTAAGAISTMSALTLGLGIATIVGGIIMGVGAMKSASKGAASEAKSISDGHIAPDGGLLVSGNKGTYQLDPKDHVIAGTGLGKSNTQTQQSSNDASVKELQEIKNILQKTYNLNVAQGLANPLTTVGTGIDLLMDKFGTKANVNTYKTQ
jgi:hypothetical protein